MPFMNGRKEVDSRVWGRVEMLREFGNDKFKITEASSRGEWMNEMMMYQL